MRLREVVISRVQVPNGRAFDPETVDKLKVSMAEIGLLNPITVRHEERGLPAILVAGRNRLEAARQLGWEAIDAVEMRDPFVAPHPDFADLAEIAENLHRRELGEIERAELMARWMEIVGNKATGPLPGQVGPAVNKDGKRKGRQHMPGGINQAARDLGIPATQLKRAARIASLSPEAKAAARVHGIETQAALLEAAKAPTPAAQVEVIERRAAKAAPAPAPATVKPMPPLASAQSAWAAIWSALSVDDRIAFKRWADGLPADQFTVGGA